MNSRSTF